MSACQANKGSMVDQWAEEVGVHIADGREKCGQPADVRIQSGIGYFSCWGHADPWVEKGSAQIEYVINPRVSEAEVAEAIASITSALKPNDPPVPSAGALIAAHEEGYERTELRRTSEEWVAVRLKKKVGGGWYIEDSISIAAPVESQDDLTCDCCQFQRTELPYHHDAHDDSGDSWDYCQQCYDIGCDLVTCSYPG